MTVPSTVNEGLGAFLAATAPKDLARVLTALADASIEVASRIRRGPLGGALHADVGPDHDGVAQKALDVFADQAFIGALKGSGVRGVVSEEREDFVALDSDGTFLVAIDPLDGSSNIEANITIGTIFSVLDAPPGTLEAAHFLQRGTRQRAAGIFVYGPHIDFAFTIGHGVSVATLDPEDGVYRITTRRVEMPQASSVFSINAANARHWKAPVRSYIEDLVEGEEGPRGRNFNMRWVGSMIAEVYRTLLSGGVYLYPEDSREGYENGRLRLLYEASPVALLIEQSGGAAIDGYRPILTIEPESIHVRSPLIFGSKDKVERVARYYGDEGEARLPPLFGKRGLMRR
ncbi:class 1 fructose-bisphosphatase [Roseiarcus sp.]|uniref:class 1 fructose-bisphosphatase n=1 Tax=Roseiarcus sp. TaxID=1969460 RepID=UPI003F98CF47